MTRSFTLRLPLACLLFAAGTSPRAQNWISDGNRIGARHGAALGDSTPSEGRGASSCTLVDNVASLAGGGTFGCTTSSSIL